MKRPFDTIKKISLINLQKSKDNYLYNFNQFDKILVWIVGFSLTAITLIVTNFSGISNGYSTCILKYVLILLAISIITGIIYRISALQFLIKYQNILFFLEGAFSEDKMMSTKIKKLKNPNDIHEIYQNIKNDFDEDYSDVLDLFNITESKKSKQFYVDYLIKEYSRLVEWSENEFNYANDYVKKVFKKAFDLSDKKINKIFNENNDSFYLKMWSWICSFSIVICLISFISVLILLSLNYK